jgi:hypothetical protein
MGGSPPPKKSPPRGIASSEADEQDRSTLVPDFDPHAFARDSEKRQRTAAQSAEPTMDEIRRLQGEGDHEGALFLLTQFLEHSPQHALATIMAAECRAALERDCLTAVGSETAVLALAVGDEELKTFALDATSGFLVSLMDGTTTVEDMLDIAGVPRLLALRHLRNLVERGIVVLASKRPVSGRKKRDTGRAADDEAVVEILPAETGPPSLESIPVLLLTADELGALDLQPSARTLLACIDEGMTVGEILAQAGFDVVDGIAILEQLAQDDVVVFV